jgi:histidinol-phosphate phosphatase family protein
MPTYSKKRAVFLDRDGTICRDVHYCSRAEDFEILPGVPQAIRLLNEHGFKVVVVTNQSGIARGYFTEQTLSLIHHKMKQELQEHGAFVDAVYFCPHHPDDNCECRKPKAWLLLRAAKDIGIDLGLSYMIGDNAKDVEAGKTAGCKTVWIAVGPGNRKGKPQHESPEHIASSLYRAVEWVLHDAQSKVVHSMEPKDPTQPS